MHTILRRRTIANILAAILLVQMVLLGWLSLSGDALTTDESPHISAGYSYLVQRDMRLNPEHPPLIKDIAALPLLFQSLTFPEDHPSWAENVNDQWVFGPELIFGPSNNPDSIMLAARTMMLLFLVLLGVFIFRWARERYGNKMGLIALFLFAFSPTFLAHGRYVTTDVGATFGFVAALYYFLRYLYSPTKRNLVFAGIFFGIAQLLKFSLFLLVPFFVGLIVLWWLAHRVPRRAKIPASLGRYALGVILIFLIGYILIWPVYLYHTADFPPERQMRDAAHILSSSPFGPAADLAVWMAEKPLLQPYGWYLTGLLMVFQRTAGGNTTYFLGDVSSDAWPHYFPVVFAIKVPVALLILMLIALGVAARRILRGRIDLARTSAWMRENFAELTWLLFIIYYWGLSIVGNLNIGVRHVLPTFPFIYLLVVSQLRIWLNPGRVRQTAVRLMIFWLLMVWYFLSSVFAFPHYLSYFNELVGGSRNGYRMVADSNLDWGQDLKRLAEFVEERNIESIKVDYFGGDSPAYRLGDRYKPMNPDNPADRTGWIAVSATILQNGRGEATKGFDQSTTYYAWLNDYEPVAQIGNSIFVYRID